MPAEEWFLLQAHLPSHVIVVLNNAWTEYSMTISKVHTGQVEHKQDHLGRFAAEHQLSPML